jgi:hypothetical protein
METRFVQLNHGWNAEPNAPFPEAHVDGHSVVLEFVANSFQFKDFVHGQKIQLLFHDAWRYGFSSVNDEGWYLGQCRFSGVAPEWGEFYEVSGDLRENVCPVDWQHLAGGPSSNLHRYLFYFRDATFECDAASWERIT